MGLAGYFRRFVKGFSIVTTPISKLLKKGITFNLSAEHESIRQNIITVTPVLIIFNPNLPTELHTDASSIGIGAALMQKEEGMVKPVAYFSRRTTNSVSKYHSYDLETLAIVDAVEHFRTYLYGLHFTVYTDCNSVRATALKKDLHPRVARWWMRLKDFDFNIEYRPGGNMGHVDYLSRNSVQVRILTKAKDATTLAEYKH